MVEALRQESFYVAGTLVDESQGLYLGWTARQGSFSDPMPLSSERGDVRLVFSGEDFPDPGTVEALRARGHAVAARGPSYLVHLYEEDPAFLSRLNGRFQGVVTDRNRGVSILFNDRYGMQRIYYHEAKDALYFAAEAKAILAVRPELRTADPRGLGESVACGCVLENRTLFPGIHVLPPAAAWTCRAGAVESRDSYFSPREWEEQEPMSAEAYYRELKDVFSNRLCRYFGGCEPIGMSLTGGLDTRLILAWRKSHAGSLPCYSFGGMFRDCQDVALARQVARACGQSHHTIVVGDEFLGRFAAYAERSIYLTDGCVDVSHAPDLYVNEAARAIAPVRMTGNYGGEVLRRVRLFKVADPPTGLFRPELLSHVTAVRETFAGMLNRHPLSFTLFNQAPWHHYGLLALEQTQVALRSPYLDNELVRTVFRAPESACTDNAVCLRLIADGDPALARIRTDLGLAGDRGPFRSAALKAMLTFTFKAEYGYDYGMPQWVARIDHVLAPCRLERLFLGRHKFYHFRVWYRNQLAKYIRDVLLDRRALSRPYIQGNVLERMVQAHINGTRNYTVAIHKALTLELIHRAFFDSHRLTPPAAWPTCRLT
ncbi:MAG: hypothetical protein LAQ30_05535 [Acidobacteriia bacterium]|nr:hypothetical protein [Terriglobia bacterium]